MSYQHAIVWIDTQHATVIDFSVDDRHVVQVEREGGPVRVHLRSGVPGDGKHPADPTFFRAVVDALGDAREVLVVGPGQGKVFFRKELEQHHPAVARRVVGMESLDHPSHGELLDFATRYFRRVDALRGDH
ncbi:MAG: translational machinery protein [Ilumatobacteraceae bacterium]